MKLSELLTRFAMLFGAAALLVCLHSPFASAAEAEKEKPATAAPAEPNFTTAQIAFFENEVQPILKANCLKCHGGESVKGELRLTSRASVLRGGEQGEAVSLKKPESSLLLDAINYKDLKMPPSGKLAPEKVAILTRWVKEGLPWTPGGPETPEPVVEKKKIDIEAGRQYWAYQPVKRPAPPVTKNTTWAKGPIDQFLLAKLEEHNLTPNGPADKVALLRRAYYDLTGLPPTPEEVDRFVNDRSPAAYERLLDQLLESPQYGEKWGRYWLDIVRYAESNGYERDDTKPNAWRYRDYVIESFNADKPYDRFIHEQLAGDELFQGDDHTAGIVATGFYRLGIWDDEPADRLQARYDELDDMVATTSQAFLGMSLNCVRCHDHKRDPFPHEDYYRMLAFFQDIRPYNNTVDARGNSTFTDISPRGEQAVNAAEVKKREDKSEELDKAIVAIENETIKRMPAADQRASEGPERGQVIAKLNDVFTKEEKRKYRELKAEFAAVNKKPLPVQEFALSVNQCIDRPPETTVMIRGNANSPGKVVEVGFPAVLTSAPAVIPKPAKDAKSSGRRGVLAQWIASKENPLTARVMMNRVWQAHFGRGFVGTPNDFGKLGQPPTHPELLDWLASEFMAGDWRLKRMHKLIMLSNAYQMSSAGRPEAIAVDGGNNWWWRFNMRRLAAEEVRDAVLSVSGRLNLKAGGPSVYVTIPAEVLAGQSKPGHGWGKSSPEDASRRSVYVFVKRSLQVPILSQHDQADTDTSCPVRYTTTVPTQSLGMINGEFMNTEAAGLAERLVKEAPGDVAAQVRRAIRLTTGRLPSADEIHRDVAFVKGVQKKHALTESQAFKQYCLLALNTNEFIYVD